MTVLRLQEKRRNGIHMHGEHSELSKEIVAFNFFVINLDTAVMKLNWLH